MFKKPNDLSNENRKILPTNGIAVVFALVGQPGKQSKNSGRLKQNTLEEMFYFLCQSLKRVKKQINQFRVNWPQSAQNIVFVKIIRNYLLALLTVAPISNNHLSPVGNFWFGVTKLWAVHKQKGWKLQNRVEVSSREFRLQLTSSIYAVWAFETRPPGVDA